MLAEKVWPRQSTAEIVIRVGDHASFVLDSDELGDDAPCLSIQDGPVQVLLFPLAWMELGQVSEADLELASELVIDATRWRDAIHRKLRSQRDGAMAPVEQMVEG